MPAARCSLCHCYNRLCPEGLPNHKNSLAIGPNCVMNAQGRHYRDQSDPSNPVCDYENGGVPCNFFSAGNPESQLPYPLDISLGPVTTQPPGPMAQGTPAQSSELTRILALLEQQKVESERQNSQLVQLQQQVTAMSVSSSNSPVDQCTSNFSSTNYSFS